MPSNARTWSSEEDRFLRDNYLTMQRKDIAVALGRSAGSVRKRCSVLLLNTKRPPMSAATVLRIVQWYAERANNPELSIDDLAREVGHHKTNISRKAREMGLTVRGRPVSESTKEKIGRANKEHIEKNGHPRGMLGIAHSQEARAKMGIAHREAWRDPNSRFNSPEYRKALSERAVANGLGALTAGEAMYSRAKKGKRADLGGRYFRSRWEANYARYLNLLVEQGKIASWEYECKTFWFEKIKRGTRSYTPDFKIMFHDGHHEWHEVKGWMDPKSKTKLDRMRRYYPNEPIVVIGEEWFRTAKRSGLAGILPGWESADARY